MQIRFTTVPPRIDWKEKVAGRWIGRTVSVTSANLERYGVVAPSAGGPLTAWHAKRLMAALDRERRVAGVPKPLLTLSGSIEANLASLDCTVGMKERRERVLRRVAKHEAVTRPKAADISLLSFVGDIPLHAITSEKLLHYQKFLNQLGYAPMSIRDFLLDMRGLFEFAVRHKHMEESPEDGLRIPPSEPRDDVTSRACAVALGWQSIGAEIRSVLSSKREPDRIFAQR